jgi:hypothetical protein
MLEDIEEGQSLGSKNALEANKDGIAYLYSLIYVPQAICKEIIRIYYNLLISRYQRIKKMHEQISRNYYIPNLQKEVTNYIKNCDSVVPGRFSWHVKPYLCQNRQISIPAQI